MHKMGKTFCTSACFFFIGDVHSLCVLDEITASDSTDPILEDLSESVVVEVVDYGLDDVHPVTNLVIDDTDTQSTVSELGLCSQR